MTAHDRVRWDGVYRQRARRPYPAPDPLLLTYTPPAPLAGDQPLPRALDLAAGVGQNGLWLAEQGYVVDVVDISRVALARARAEMASRNLRNVNLLQADMDEFDIEAGVYDLICVFRYLKRDMMPCLRAGVRIGGRIIYETFNINYLDVVPDFNTDFLLMPEELAAMFDGWKLLHALDDGPISQVVAVKTGDE